MQSIAGLVNNLRLVWIQKHYAKGYTKNRVQDLIFVPYRLQKLDEWDRRKQLSSFYLSYLLILSMWYLKVILKTNQCQKYWHCSSNRCGILLETLSPPIHYSFISRFTCYILIAIPKLFLGLDPSTEVVWAFTVLPTLKFAKRILFVQLCLIKMN